MNIIPNLPILHSKKTVGKFVFTQNYLQSHGDRMLLSKYPELLNTPIYIKFDSSIPVFNNYEFYGFVMDYIV